MAGQALISIASSGSTKKGDGIDVGIVVQNFIANVLINFLISLASVDDLQAVPLPGALETMDTSSEIYKQFETIEMCGRRHFRHKKGESFLTPLFVESGYGPRTYSASSETGFASLRLCHSGIP